MATVLEELVVQIRADQKGFTKDITALQAEVKALTKTVDTGTGGIKGFGSAANIAKGFLIGNGLIKAVDFLKQAMTESAKEAIRFEKGIAEINSILPETAQLTSRTTDTIRQFSAQFGTGQAQQAKAYYQIVSAGVTDAAKATNLLKVANKSAIAGITSVENAVNGLTSVLAVYEKQGLTAEEASDILFTTVKEGKTTFGDLSANIGKVSAIAETAGVAFSDLSGAVAFLTKSGIRTEEATTSIRALMSAIIKPTEDAKKAAASLGIELSATALSAKGMAGFFEEVRIATKGNVELMAKLFPNVQSLSAAAQFAGSNFSDFSRILDSTKNSMGSTDAAAEKMQNTLDFKLDQAKSELTLLGTTLFDWLKPAIEETTGSLTEMLQRFNKSADAINRISKPINNGADAVSNLEAQLDLARLKLEDIQNAANFRGFVNEQALKDQMKLIADLESQLDQATEKQLENEAKLAARKKSAESGGVDKQIEDVKKLSEAEIEAILKKQQAEAELALQREEFQKSLDEAEKERQKTKLIELTTAQEEHDLATLEGLQKQKEEELAIVNDAEQKKFITAEQAEIARTNIEKKQQKQREKNLDDTLGTIATLTESNNKALKSIGKAAAITTAVQDTYAAANKALASAPPPFNYGLAAAVTAAGLANVAKIAGLQSGIDSVPGVGTRDNFPALLAPGERVVPAESNKDLTKFLQNQGNSAPSTTVQLIIEGNYYESDDANIKLVERIQKTMDRTGLKFA